MPYDFKSARERINFLTQLYRVGRKLCPDDTEWGWDLIAQIEELEREIAEAHASQNGKIAVRQDGYPVVQIENVIIPSIDAWGRTCKIEGLIEDASEV